MNAMSQRQPLRHRPVAALLLLSLGAASCYEAPVPKNAPPLDVTAVHLSKAYEDSEGAAQRRYGNRPLRVTGRVTAITSDPADNAVIRMKGGSIFTDVYLTVTEDSREQSERVTKGSELTMRCEGAAEVLGSPTLDGCTFERPAEALKATEKAKQ